VEIHVVQGERPIAGDNKSLGRFILDGIPPAPRGIPQIEVTFDIDANGILNVSARDKASGKEQRITITAGSGLSDSEIDKMVKEAEKHASEDAKRKEQVEVKNQAETAVFNMEKFLRDYGNRLPEDAKAESQKKMAAVNAVKDGSDIANIRNVTEDLNQYMQSLGAKMYENGATPDGNTAPNTEDVVDGEYTEQ
jgi:molecular chaperone DnaK